MTAGSIDTSSDLHLVAADDVDAATPAAGAGEPTQLEYLPGLDGLRAIAVLAVMSGHLPYASSIVPEWLVGSWLGVSTFFTMSGFLITRLLLAERARTGGVSLGGFWTRRAKRLLPALYTCIAFLLLLSVLDIAPPDRSLGDQVLALVLYFKNGLLLYFDGPNGPTFFQMWSLSIEEQFYLVFPLLFLGASMWLRRRAWIVFAGLLVLTQWLMIDVSRRGTFDGYVTAYFSTFTRSAEVLAGVLLAYAVTSGWWRRLVPTPGFRLARQVLGVVGLVLLIHLFRIADVSWDLTHKWTMWTSIATVAVIVGCTTVGGAATVLSCRPLRWIGKVSYGAYLYHLGVYFVLTPERTGIASHFGLSVVRYARDLRRRRSVVPVHRVTPPASLDAHGVAARRRLRLGGSAADRPRLHAPAERDVRTPGSHPGVRSPPTTPPPASTPPGSPWWATGAASGRWPASASSPGPPRAGTSSTSRLLSGCPIAGSGTLVVDGRLRDTPLTCTLWHASAGVGRPAPNVVVVQLGAADLVDRRVGEGELAHLGEAKADARLTLEPAPDG